MTYDICIDKRNTIDIIKRLAKDLGSNPFLQMTLKKVSEVPIVETATGKEVYRLWDLEMESGLPSPVVSAALKILGFTKDKFSTNTFYM